MIGDKILKKTLITGAGGMVGSYMDFGMRFNSKQLDVTNWKQVSNMVKKYRPKTIVHMAALTDLAECERDPAKAYLINGAGTYYMALAARNVGARFIYISTNSVFDGSKSDLLQVAGTPDPKSVYGHSKFLGELAVKSMLKDYAILRTCWIFGGGRVKDKKFVGHIMRKIHSGETRIQASSDNIGSPTYAKDLVLALRQFIMNKRVGTFHVVNSGACSRAEEAREIVGIVKAKIRIVPVPAKKFGLSSDRLHEALKPQPNMLRPWQKALQDYLISEW